jgi:protein tyrosine/serine phosphatase
MQGRDRTGTFMACLFALLGINDDGIIKDYELSAVAQGGGTRWNLQYGTSETSSGTP